MKKRLIPATIAALALSSTAVVTPQAVAQDSPEVTVGQGDQTFVQWTSFLEHLDSDIDDTTAAYDALDEISIDAPWLSANYVEGGRHVIATAEAPEGNHDVTVTITFSDESDLEPIVGTLNVQVDDTTDPVITAEDSYDLEVGQAADITITVDDDDAVLATSDLPEGLTFTPETGKITGTPTTAGDATVTITATDSEADNSSTKDITLNVAADTTAPVITDIADQNWAVDTPIAPIAIEVNEDAEVEVTGLPEGLNYDKGNNQIWGAPTETGDGTVTITAEDAAGNDAENVTFDFNVGTDITDPVITGIDDQEWHVGSAVDLTIEVSEDAEVDVEGLPDGVTFDDDTLKISGTPTEIDEGTVTITAVDAAGNEANEVSFAFNVAEASDEGSSIDGSSGGAIGIAIAAVVAAIAAFLGAVGSGIIQLPPAIANLLPF